MTEKRFTYMIDRVFDLWGVYDNKEKVICLVRNTDAKDLCDLLNELNNENKQLRNDCSILVQSNQNYRKENEQLKEDKQSLIEFIKKEFPKSHKHILEGFE